MSRTKARKRFSVADHVAATEGKTPSRLMHDHKVGAGATGRTLQK
jgi:hypothetical protein